MLMNDVTKKDEIRTIAVENLRKMGIKFRPKKSKHNAQEPKIKGAVFGVGLQFLPMQTITFPDGQQLVIPVLVHELCSFILGDVTVEGIFRKEGSKARQQGIKDALTSGYTLSKKHHVIDVAVVLKTFLRGLPEPLIPYFYHDYFIRCMLLERIQMLHCVQLMCLLLPIEHLNTLVYLLRFFQRITEHSHINKMSSNNLAIVIGPNIIPFEDKFSAGTQQRLVKTCELIQLMIEAADSIGVIPEYIIEQIENKSFSEEDSLLEKKKKKRRSGSLTRMFNGIKKIVGTKQVEEPLSVTPDLLSTPSITMSSKKRRVEANGLSNKKKKEIISSLPNAQLLSTPFTPRRTTSSQGLGKSQKDAQKEKLTTGKEKKPLWYTKTKNGAKPAKSTTEDKDTRQSLGARGIIERRWSAVSQAAKKKRNSFAGSLNVLKNNYNKLPETIRDTTPVTTKFEESDYVRVPKTEYEEIKSRVSAIERRISLELDCAEAIHQSEDVVQKVQTAYEETLVKSEPLSPTTDQLAKRLSRELKIRRHSEKRVIRSPSARKIGSLRRRSKELERQNIKLNRTQTWSGSTKPAISTPHFEPEHKMVLRSSNKFKTPSPSIKSFTSALSCDLSGHSTDKWVSAEGFFATETSIDSGCITQGRPSVAKIRAQNAGMVLAKAKLFDNLVDSDKSNERSGPKPRVNSVNKVGSIRDVDSKRLHKNKNVRNEDRRSAKKSTSPRKRGALSNKQKIPLARQVASKENFPMLLNNETPTSHKQRSPTKNAPSIKRALITRSPRRLCKTSKRNTPLKALSTPNQFQY